MEEVIRCQAERLKSHSSYEEKLKDIHIVFIELPCTSSFCVLLFQEKERAL